MNCKPGDLAIMVRSFAGNEGRILRCVRLSDWPGLTLPDRSVEIGPVWEVDQQMSVWGGQQHNLVLDSFLRPIRPQPDDAQDESKAWLPPVPSTTKEHA